MSITVLFHAIQFSFSKQFSSICPQDRTLLGATTPGQSEHGSGAHERVLRIPQSSSITDCLVSHSLEDFFTPLQRWSQCILQPQLTGQYTELNVFISDNSV